MCGCSDVDERSGVSVGRSMDKRPALSSLSSSGEGVDLPSDDEVEDDESEDSNRCDRREGIDQEDNGREQPDRSESNTHPTKELAKSWSPEHGNPKSEQGYRQDTEPCDEQCIEYALGHLPHKDQSRLIRGGRVGSVI